MTVVTFSKMVGSSMDAATELAKEGIDVEVINLRSIRPLDRQTIIESVKKTHHLVVVEEGWPQCGIGSEICALLMESINHFNKGNGFDYLDAPVERITGLDIPMAYSEPLEELSLPKVKNIKNAILKTLVGFKR